MIMLKRRNLIFILIVAIIVGALCSGSFFYFVKANNSVTLSNNEYEQLQAFNEKYAKLDNLYRYITKNYYIPVDEKDLEEGLYKGLVWGLGDPYSSYLTADEYEQMIVSTSGEYEGIGVTIEGGKDGYVTIVGSMDGSPAYKVGIKSGDRITSINGKNYTNVRLNEAATALRGKSGTKVKITVVRNNNPMNFEIIRTKIITETVTSKMLEDNIGYIRISAFEENTAKIFETELRTMEVNGVKGLVIDLRDNSGGLVVKGAEIADLLLPAGIITYTQDREGKKQNYKSDASYTDIPFTVLINGGSASTSEIVVAAIKDHKAGKLVGKKTFGKGIIQSVEKLKDGDAIKMTVMRYFSPNGNVINKLGVKPDVDVEQVGDETVDEQLQKAIEILNVKK